VVTRVLVLAPLRVIEGTWMEEPGLWPGEIDLKVNYAIGTPGERLNAIDRFAEVVVMNYENVAWLVNTYGKALPFDGIIYDELTKLKTVSGTQFKKLRYLYDTFAWRCGMAAGSDNDGLEDMYGQMMMLDNGAALGRRKDKFLERWFTPIDYERRQWEAKEGAAEEVAALCAPCVYSPDPSQYEKSLPRLSITYWEVPLPNNVMAMYKRLEYSSVVKELSIKAVNAAVVSGKLQQICSGFIYDEDDVVDLHRQKQDRVYKLMGTLARRGPVLISYWFDEELAQLQELFPDAPIVGKTGGVNDLCKRWNADLLRLHRPRGGWQRTGCRT
jgi:hypothetical protein